MATTINAVVLKHQQKKDGTFPVKIRLIHNRVTRYLDTQQYVSRKQLDKDYNIKDGIVSKPIALTLEKYRDAISRMEEKLDFFDCDGLLKLLKTENKPIDFLAFGWAHANELERKGRTGTARTFKTVLRSLEDYFGRNSVLITEINTPMLRAYERYVVNPRKLERVSKRGNTFFIDSPGLTVSGLHNHMRDLRCLFNVARDAFNDEDLGVIRIAHYPFKSYKLQKPPETQKRNLPVEKIKAVRDYPALVDDGRVELARDLFMLSFYMCGTNSVDFYYLTAANVRDGRIEYKRRKTKGKRKDEAFISIKIVEEAKPLLDKYIGKLQSRFSSHSGLSTAISQGFRKFRNEIGEPDISHYWARHSFATLARNVCRKSKDDVALALNHVDEGRKTTDIYIEKDWRIVDEVQDAVVSLLRKKRDDEQNGTIMTNSPAAFLLLGQINLPVLQK